MAMSRNSIIIAVVIASPPALADSGSKFAIIPHLGVTSEGAYLDGPIVFSDGDVDSILVEPDTGILVGVAFSYQFSPKVAGVLGVSFTSADARYIESNDLRRDIGFDTIRIQPGVMANVARSGKVGVDLGGGLTLYQMSIDGMVWNDRLVDSSGGGLGLFGAAALAVRLTPRLSFHSHLMLELSRPFYGGFEADIAAADGEADADVDHDTRLGVVLGLGLRIDI